MRVDEVQVTRYRTPDGGEFVTRAEAVGRADELAIARLTELTPADLADVISGRVDQANPLRMAILWIGTRTMETTVRPAPAVATAGLGAGPVAAAAE